MEIQATKLNLWLTFLAKHQEILPHIAEIQHSLGYTFKSQELLLEALTHRSAVAEVEISRKFDGIKWNERLEFLGDSVLSLAVSSILWSKENYSEGDLSKIRSSLVNEQSLAAIAREINLGPAVILGRGEAKSGGRKRNALLADALEAILGAIYLDAGFDATRIVVQRIFQNALINVQKNEEFFDYKTNLQEWTQDLYKVAPHYEISSESGPDHEKEFEVSVHLNGDFIAKGKGKSKKSASQEAARLALSLLTQTSSKIARKETP